MPSSTSPDGAWRTLTCSYLVQPPPSDPRSVVYLTITERAYPRKLAFLYLEELAREFETSYGAQVQQRNLRPYAFVGFDTFLQRTKRLYADSRTAESATGSNLDRLNEDLQGVQKIMTKNMEDLLWRGDSLDRTCPQLRRTRSHAQKCPACRRLSGTNRCGTARPLSRLMWMLWSASGLRTCLHARALMLTASVGAITILALFILYIKLS